MADEKITYTGVYHRDDDGRPLAIFRDGDAAQAFRRSRLDYDQTMIASADGLDRNTEVADHFKATAPAEVAPAVDAAELQDTLLRNQIRSEESERRRRDQIRSEVVKELDADAKKSDRPAELHEPAAAPRSR